MDSSTTQLTDDDIRTVWYHDARMSQADDDATDPGADDDATDADDDAADADDDASDADDDASDA
ncbi:MAG TPA: hypothetical protein VKZ55_11210 [Microthrixaceae bacterium]|nr:hypothetical protein [Microthrixaceae bacterium]